MTNQEAIEIITNAVQTEKMTIEQDKALAIVQEALENIEQEKKINENLITQLKTAQETIEHLRNEIKNIAEKQIPKKPLPENKYYGNGKCPNCNAFFLDKSTKFCGNCGQALDWSE